ncbi:DNA-binding Lrp family transcriptional regulator [Actinocorallia herbida]|uniref:DNA-binding Lrp family transcriptional regulator n=1 Tax=Actinocorallia herbida TaxID=58109 RepID=A0A3N1CWI5_9ACTN|nr:Lrp/AsnC family transcriptional regulator [Actinocorallia herbida]ROO85078.1 DNA-binding Lrp family transcriptional regulator [Actinocorallia herbida]
MPKPESADAVDARILLELARDPRATTVAVAERVGIARNTAQARLSRLERDGTLDTFERRVSPDALGYSLAAFITARVTQRRLDEVGSALAAVPEVLEVHGISGADDLLIHVVAAHADDLYRIAGLILAIPGIERSSTSLVMRSLVPYRITPLLRRAADER